LLCNTQDEYDEVIAWLYSLINQNEKLKAFNVEKFNSVVKMILKEVAKRLNPKSKPSIISRFLKL